jgi:branched-chain amino acid aminotransferase
MSINTEYSLTECERSLVEILQKNNLQEDTHTRHTVFLGGFGSYDKNEPTIMVIIPCGLGRVYDLEKGISCSISSWIRINDNSVPPRAKVGANYVNSRLATIEAQKNGYDQPIILNLDGKVSECASSCFFMIRKGIVVTPSVTAGILESVTRDTLLELCRNELNLTPEEREIDRTETYVADEAFLCASGAEIVPITSIDKIPLGNARVGLITQKIMDLYLGIVRGTNPKYYKWLTPTYGE